MAIHALGLFEAPSQALAAAGKLKADGFGRPSVISPIPLEAAEEVLGEKKSAIKHFTFFGACSAASAASYSLPARLCSTCIPPAGGRSLPCRRF